VTSWRDVQEAAPELARRVRAVFDSHRHKTLATLRADGSPRISGRAYAVGEPGPDGDRFRADIGELVHTHLDPQATLLVVEWWTPEGGLRKAERT
jgi:hypothetical protein